MFWGIICIVLVSATANCVRPTDYHWLVDNTPTNTSIKLFSGNSGMIERIYFNFAYSECTRFETGNILFFCDDKSFSIPCKYNNIQPTTIGLGQNSPIWSHYQHMIYDNQRIDLSNDQKTYDAKCGWQSASAPYRLCVLENIKTDWTYQGSERSEEFSIHLFSNQQRSTIPKKIYQTFEEAIQEQRYDDIYVNLYISGKKWKCGKDCLYTNSYVNGFELWIQPDLSGEEQFELNERFMQYKKIKYSSFSQTIHIDDDDVFINQTYKLFVQVLLIPKIIYGFWVFSRRKEEYCDPEKEELFYEIFDIIALALITLEEVSMHNTQIVHIIFIILMITWIFLMKVYEYGVHDKRSKENFEACIVIGNLIPIFILQTMIQELDSYECVVIALSLQSVFIINELFEVLFLYNSKQKIAYQVKFLWTVLVNFPMMVINHRNWLSIFFDEIISLIGYHKMSVELLYYILLVSILFEIWKRRLLFNKIKFF